MAYRKVRSDHVLAAHLAAGANHGLRLLTTPDGAALTQNVPLLYDANGNVVATATRTGNTTNFGTAIAGAKTSGNYPKWDANGNLDDGDTGPTRVRVAKAGTLVGTRTRLNLIEGSNVTITAADDSVNDEIDVTVASTGGGGGGASISTGTRASRPASPGASGEYYRCTDGPYIYIAGGSPLAWQAWANAYPVIEPDDSIYAWINQGGASVTTTNGGIFLRAPADASSNLRIRKKAAPGTPWTLTIAFVPALLSVNYHGAGAALRESSTGKLITLWFVGSITSQVGIARWNSPTSWSSNPVALNSSPAAPAVFLRVNDNGTNLVYSVSFDGQNFLQLLSESRTAWLAGGPDEIGFYVNSQNASYEAGMWLLHWLQA